MFIRVRFASALLMACGAMASTISFAGSASAICNEARCVPNVAQGVAAGSSCTPRKYFNYGLDPTGATLVCNKIGTWTATGPLLGVYNVTLRCATQGTSAQGSDGVAFLCTDLGGGGLRWAHRTDTLE